MESKHLQLTKYASHILTTNKSGNSCKPTKPSNIPIKTNYAVFEWCYKEDGLKKTEAKTFKRIILFVENKYLWYKEAIKIKIECWSLSNDYKAAPTNISFHAKTSLSLSLESLVVIPLTWVHGYWGGGSSLEEGGGWRHQWGDVSKAMM